MTDDRCAVLRVRTPEGVVFSFQLASPVTRLAAWAIDKGTIMAAWTLIATLLRLAGLLGVDFAGGLLVVGFFVVSTGYGIAFEWAWRGQTLGKRLMHLRVLDEQGLPLQLPQVVVRNLLRAVDVLPVGYFVGGVTALLNAKAQRLGDIGAATIVVREAPPPGWLLASLPPSKYNSLRTHAHLVARLRAGTSPELAQAALQALVRREGFDPEARVELFAEFARYFRDAMRLPPELTEGIADEQLVRNVVEVLFQTATAPAVRAA